MSLTKNQLIRATTTSPWTKNFRHLLPFPRHWLRRTSIQDPRIKAVAVKDRIKYWNIVPGDQIRVRGDPANTVHEVLSINRFSNRVFLKGQRNEEDEENPSGRLPPTKNVHYSRCQLYLGEYEFPPARGSTQSRNMPVFAQRLGTSKPYWQRMGCRWEWNRIAVATSPTLPAGYEEKVKIPWPRPEKRNIPQPSFYDTTEELVKAVTYTVPVLPSAYHMQTPRPPPESMYLKAVYNPGYTLPQKSLPYEVHLVKELSNPHSRAKKQARWQAHKIYKKELLESYVAEEKKNLNGRTVREARAEATLRWRQALEQEKKAEMKRRWLNKATEARFLRKRDMKLTRERKQRERLSAMVLTEAENQVIPRA